MVTIKQVAQAALFADDLKQCSGKLVVGYCHYL